MKPFEEIKTLPNLILLREGIDGGAGELWRAGKHLENEILSDLNGTIPIQPI